jgi:hypothetical protein
MLAQEQNPIYALIYISYLYDTKIQKRLVIEAISSSLFSSSKPAISRLSRHSCFLKSLA